MVGVGVQLLNDITINTPLAEVADISYVIICRGNLASTILSNVCRTACFITAIQFYKTIVVEFSIINQIFCIIW